MVFLLKVLKECAGAGPEALALGREARFTQPRRTRVRLRKRAKASGGSFRLGWLLWCLLLGQSLNHEVWRSAWVSGRTSDFWVDRKRLWQRLPSE